MGRPSVQSMLDTLLEDRAEVFRETLTMTLYIGLSLDAVIVGARIVDGEIEATSAWQVFWVAAGLIIAHMLAFQVSTRYVGGHTLGRENVELLVAQVGGGIVVTLVAVVPLLLGLPFSEALLEGLVLLVAYHSARRAGRGRIRSLGYVVVVLIAVLLMLAVKSVGLH